MIKGIKQLLDQEKLKRLGLLSLERILKDVSVCMINFYIIMMVVDKVHESSNPTIFKLGTFNETSSRSIVNKWKKVLPKTVSGELLKRAVTKLWR